MVKVTCGISKWKKRSDVAVGKNLGTDEGVRSRHVAFKLFAPWQIAGQEEVGSSDVAGGDKPAKQWVR